MSFHTPAHRSGTAAQVFPRINALVDCPNCDSCNPEIDEDGRPYTCYCCFDTGSVPLDFQFERYVSYAEYAVLRPAPVSRQVHGPRHDYFPLDDDSIPF